MRALLLEVTKQCLHAAKTAHPPPAVMMNVDFHLALTAAARVLMSTSVLPVVQTLMTGRQMMTSWRMNLVAAAAAAHLIPKKFTPVFLHQSRPISWFLVRFFSLKNVFNYLKCLQLNSASLYSCDNWSVSFLLLIFELIWAQSALSELLWQSLSVVCLCLGG